MRWDGGQRKASEEWADTLFITALTGAAFCLPWYNIGLSVAQMVMGVAVLWPVGMKQRWRKLFQRPEALLGPGLFGLLAVSLTYSDDKALGFQLLKTYIPFFSFPVALALRGGVSEGEWRRILWAFLIGILVAVGFNFLYSVNNPSNPTAQNHREWSRTVSHLRLGYFAAWGLMLVLEGGVRRWLSPRITAFWVVVLGLTLLMLKSLAMLPFLIFGFLLWLRAYGVWKRPWARWVLFGGLAGLIWIAYGVGRAYWNFQRRADPERLRQVLALEPPYEHWDGGAWLENGTPAFIGIHEAALERAWSRRSSRGYWERDSKGQPVRTTLLRYLASKGHWIKDSSAVAALSPQDIRAVEQGLTNHLMRGPLDVAGRAYEFFWEWRQFQKDQDPRGRSLATRWALWQAGLAACRAHLRRGVGLGDVREAVSEILDAQRSPLIYEKKFGPHQQWLGLILAGGIPLFGWTLLFLLWPFFLRQPVFFIRKEGYKLFFFTLLILGCGMWEDIFETQASVTFFSFFLALLQSSVKTSRS